MWISTTASKYRLYVGRVLSAAVICCACLFSTVSVSIEPKVQKWGVFDFTPTLTADFAKDDNIFQRDAETVSSYLAILAPQLEVSLQNNNSRYAVTLELIEGMYSDSPADEYSDWHITGDAYHEFNSRNALDIDIDYRDGHENRGADLTRYRELPDNIILYDQLTYALKYTYGSDSSRGRLIFEHSGIEKTYDNLDEITSGQNFTRRDYSAAFHYAALARTKFFVELQYADVSYADRVLQDVNFRQGTDSTETYAYFGINWEASAQFSGDLKLGEARKSYVESGQADSQGISYEGQLEWSPLSYSRLTLNASQRFDESLGFADARERAETTLRWDHVWNRRFRTVVTASHLDFTYIGEELSEQYSDLSIGVTYSISRWLDLRLELLRNKLVSTREGFGFDQNNVTVGINASL